MNALIFPTLVAAWLGLATGAFSDGADGMLRVDVFFTEEAAPHSRTLSDSNGLAAVLISSGARPLSAGVSSALFSLGPMVQDGFLRILDDPLGLSPESTAFREPSGLDLNTGFSPGRRLGVQLGLIPGIGRLFAATGGSAPDRTGICLVIPWSASVKAELVCSLTAPEPEGNISDEWFLDSVDRHGGLFHGGMRLTGRSAGLTFSSLTGFVCGSETAPSAFQVFWLSTAGPAWRLSATAGLTLPGYVNPASRSLSDRLAGTVFFSWRPDRDIVLAATIRYAKTEKDEQESVVGHDTIEGRLRTVWQIRVDGKQAFRLESGVQAAGSCEEGETTGSGKLTTGLTMALADGQDAFVDHTIKMQDAGFINRSGAGLTLTLSAFRFELKGAFEFETSRMLLQGNLLIDFSPCELSIESVFRPWGWTASRDAPWSVTFGLSGAVPPARE